MIYRMLNKSTFHALTFPIYDVFCFHNLNWAKKGNFKLEKIRQVLKNEKWSRAGKGVKFYTLFFQPSWKAKNSHLNIIKNKPQNKKYTIQSVKYKYKYKMQNIKCKM